jgi:outer membrane protein insertion porin family
LFLLGGANSLRGYDWYSVGRKKRSEKAYQRAITAGKSVADAEIFAQRPFGGEQQLYYQAEFEFPLISEAGIKGVTFFDIGSAEDNFVDYDFRSDVGFGFRWFSPIGPLRFEWGFPLGRREGESASNFQFAVGSPF